jgi:hypothetical protein
MSVNRAAVLEREGSRQVLAGALAIATLPIFILTQIVLSETGFDLTGMPTETFRSFHDHQGAFIAQGLLTALLYAVMVYPLYYLFRAAQARSQRVNPAMVGFVFLGPLLYALSNVVLAFAQSGVASDFASQSAAGGDIYNLLSDIQDDSTLTQIGTYLQLPAALGLVVAIFYTALNAFRVGLLTRFFGTLGMALAVAQILVPQLGRPALMAWFAWLGFLILDRIPKGRPPAWDAGEAIPWPRPGEDVATAGAPVEAIEGDATEAFEPSNGAADHSARRERARKRKRKRRR